MFSIVKPVENEVTFRANIRNALYTKVETYTTSHRHSVSSEQLNQIARHLERATYNHTLSMASTKKIVKKWDNPNFVNLYLTQMYRLMCTLDHTSILSKLFEENSVRARDIPAMSAQELCPEKWSALIQMKLERDKNLFNEDDQATTDQFTCWKCKKKKCVFYELQTSSGDESTTIFITCLSCGNRWKIR